MVVIHYTAMGSAAAACRTLCNPETEVSAHYLIAADGAVMSLVDEDQRAWHAGAGAWGSVSDINSRSIGIELDNTGATPFAAGQMDALVDLLRGIVARWAIRPERIIGHSDMAPGRKIDPGVRFDWRRLALADVGIWWTAGLRTAVSWPVFRAYARTFGYPKMADELLLATMRMRFRPWAKGDLDQVDMGILADLARRFPVDAHTPTA